MLRVSEKTNEPISGKRTDRRKKGRKDRQYAKQYAKIQLSQKH